MDEERGRLIHPLDEDAKKDARKDANKDARKDACTSPCVTDLQAIRKGVEELVEGDQISKDVALTVTRLFHAAEMLLQHESHARVREVAALKSEVERMRLQSELERLARRKTLDDVTTYPPQPTPPPMSSSMSRLSRRFA